MVPVHIGEFRAAAESCTLAVYGLGSCVAVILFDPEARAGGLAHVLLPGPRPAADPPSALPAKYATEALDALVPALEALGARRGRLRAALAGGARLFEAAEEVDSNIGPRNAAAVKARLGEAGIPLAAEELGGTQGRTVLLHLPDLLLEVRTLRGGRTTLPLRP